MARLFSSIVFALVATREAYPAPAFDAYINTFGLQFSDSEFYMRRALYEERLAFIDRHNAKGSLWTAGVNHLTAATTDELASNLGYNKMHRQNSNSVPSVRSANNATLSEKPLRETIDWRDVRPNVVTAVKSQGSCGSCWAFTAAAVLESHIALATGVLFELSPQQLNSCTPNPDECGGSGGCSGATAQLAFNYTIASGISSGWTYPYLSGVTRKTEECRNTSVYSRRVAGISNYVQLSQNNAGDLMRAVQYGPVAVSVAASDWYMYHGGIFDGCNKSNPILNHAVTLMGYGQVKHAEYGTIHYWLIRNSWSATWGEKGYIRLRRYPYGEPCGVDTEPLDGYGCKAYPSNSITACGECGILSDSAYPIGAFLGAPFTPEDPAMGGKGGKGGKGRREGKGRASLQPNVFYP